MCDQKHTSAMKMSCSAAFNRTLNILHCRSFILINTLGLKTHPDAWKTWDTRRIWVEASAMGETVSGIIVSYLSETLQPLWAREQGEAGISLTKSATEHKYNPCVGLLQLGPCPWFINFIDHYDSFGFTICPQFTQHCNKRGWQCHILNHETRSASSEDHTRKANIQGN